jgi:sortase A
MALHTESTGTSVSDVPEKEGSTGQVSASAVTSASMAGASASMAGSSGAVGSALPATTPSHPPPPPDGRRAASPFSVVPSWASDEDNESNPTYGNDEAPSPSGKGSGKTASRNNRVELAGLALTVVGVLLAMFLLYLYVFSGLTGARNQNQLLHSLTGNPKAIFSLASGRAPRNGQPVAILDIPALGLNKGVVEGTTAADLQLGPGLVSSNGLSGLPGEPGSAVIAGRRVSFGGPFSKLGNLQPGDKIHVFDGAGSFTFSVTSVQTVNNGIISVPTYGRSWLTLVTSNSSWLPTGRLVVVARIDGQTATTKNPRGGPYSLPSFGGDPAAGVLAALWALAFLVILVMMLFTIRRWRQPMVSWLLAAPILLACGLFACESLARCLPSTL